MLKFNFSTLIHVMITFFNFFALKILLFYRVFFTQIEISLPIFNISKSYDLQDSLQAMGINRLFNAKKADFSEMSSSHQPLYLSNARHKTFLSVSMPCSINNFKKNI